MKIKLNHILESLSIFYWRVANQSVRLSYLFYFWMTGHMLLFFYWLFKMKIKDWSSCRDVIFLSHVIWQHGWLCLGTVLAKDDLNGQVDYRTEIRKAWPEPSCGGVLLDFFLQKQLRNGWFCLTTHLHARIPFGDCPSHCTYREESIYPYLSFVGQFC